MDNLYFYFYVSIPRIPIALLRKSGNDVKDCPVRDSHRHLRYRGMTNGKFLKNPYAKLCISISLA